MANERLYQFPSKASPVPADIIFCGDSAAAFDEVNITIAALVGAYPNLLGIGGLTIAANTFIFSNNSNVLTTAPITALAVSLLADATIGTMQSTLGYTATPTASLFAGWDANINLSANNFISAYATTVTAAATTTLLVGSNYQQYFTGTTTQTVLLPVTSTLVLGQSFFIVNNSTGVVTVQSSGGNTIQAMAANTNLFVTCILTSGTTAASWSAFYDTETSITLPLSLANGGTNASLTASNGGLIYSTGSAFAVLAGTATANQIPLSGSSSAPSWSTLTYLNTMAINTIPFASSANVMSVIAAAASSVLVTSAGNVPSLSQTLPSAVQANITSLGAQSQALNMNTHLINSVVDPVSAQDAATKNYVDQTALTGTSVYAASAASLGTVTQSGAGVGATLTNAGAQATFALDGVNPPVGVNVLIKNTATGMTAANEGIYTVTNAGSNSTNWILTRATDYDQTPEINRTGLIIINNGSTLKGTAWYNTATIVTVDTTNFSYSQFGTSLTKAAITQINVVVITATGSNIYTPSSGLQFCTSEIVGGGGSGGGAGGAAGQGSGGSGGGGGGYSCKTYTAANIGASATIVIGSGGAPATAGANPGNAGGNSTFTCSGTGVTLTATGGGAGTGGTASASINTTGSTGAGGTGTNGDINISGNNGSFGFALATGSLISGGAGGGSFFAQNTATELATASDTGYAGNRYGGGSSGGMAVTSNAASQAGAPGICYITEYISV